jgi:hypothetical protein
MTSNRVSLLSSLVLMFPSISAQPRLNLVRYERTQSNTAFENTEKDTNHRSNTSDKMTGQFPFRTSQWLQSSAGFRGKRLSGTVASARSLRPPSLLTSFVILSFCHSVIPALPSLPSTPIHFQDDISEKVRRTRRTTATAGWGLRCREATCPTDLFQIPNTITVRAVSAKSLLVLNVKTFDS